MILFSKSSSFIKLFKDFKYVIPQGSIMSTLGTPIIASLSNCWVEASPLDSYSGIMHTDANLAFYYKRRGGVGTDLSNLRPMWATSRVINGVYYEGNLNRNKYRRKNL